MRLPLRLTLLAAALCVFGCAPRVLQQPPAAWPETWRGRHLFHTPRAYIYAGSPALAGQADRIAEEVARDFEKATARPASKGLLVVSDIKDEPVFTDFKAFFFAALRASSRQPKVQGPTGSQPAQTQPSTAPSTQPAAADAGMTDAQLEAIWQSFSETKKKTGFDPMEMILIAPLPLAKEQFAPLLSLPTEVADQAGWAVLLPSDAMLRQGVHKMMAAMLKNGEIGLAARIAMAPLVLALEPKMVDMIALTRKVALFEQMARQQTDWTPEQVAKLSKAYSDGQLKTVTDAMMSDAKIKAAGIAASQAAGQPASQPATAPEAQPASAPATQPGQTSQPATASSPGDD